MTELPTWQLILLLETLVVLLLVLGGWIFISLRRARRTRAAVDSLVQQIRKQSELRLKETGSFLEENYRLEGEALQQAVEQVDKAEKRFFQRCINLYLKREDERLHSLDAWVADLVGVYKSLRPADSGSGADEAMQQQLDALQSSKQKLEEELKITKATMSGMIAEFGNLFGGGRDSALEQSEVVEKVLDGDTIDAEKVTEILQQAEDAESTPEVKPAEVETVPEETPSGSDDEALPDPAFDAAATEGSMETLTDDLAIEADEDIDELLDGIDLSDGEELEPPK